MSRTSVSVIVPLYNHEKYISSALYSVFAQTYPADELIVIDDGSSDASAGIVEAIATVRPEVVFWSHPNRGAHNTINAGLHRASGDLVAILNSDDLYEPSRLERAVAAFEADPALDLWGSRLRFIDGADRAIPNPWFEDVLAFYRAAGNDGLSLVNGNVFMTTSNFVIRRSVFGEVGHFSDLRYAHDMDFLLRLVARGRRIAFSDHVEVGYRFHASNTISEGAAKVKLEWAAAIAMYLSQIWRDGTGWEADAPRYLAVLRKNTLLELVLLFLAYFRNKRMETLEHATYRNDAAFNRLLQDVVT